MRGGATPASRRGSCAPPASISSIPRGLRSWCVLGLTIGLTLNTFPPLCPARSTWTDGCDLTSECVGAGNAPAHQRSDSRVQPDFVTAAHGRSAAHTSAFEFGMCVHQEVRPAQCCSDVFHDLPQVREQTGSGGDATTLPVAAEVIVGPLVTEIRQHVRDDAQLTTRCALLGHRAALDSGAASMSAHIVSVTALPPGGGSAWQWQSTPAPYQHPAMHRKGGST